MKSLKRQKSKMGRPEQYPLAKALAYRLLADDGDDKSALILFGEIEDAWEKGELDSKNPTERTVSRWKAGWLDEGDAEKAHWRRYTWPGAHKGGTLPWEAGVIGVAIKKAMAKVGKFPTISHISWAFRLSVVAPGMPLVDGEWNVMDIAQQLSAHEQAQGVGVWYPAVPEDQRITFEAYVDDLLIWAPWKDEKAAVLYQTNNTFHHRKPLGFLISGTPARAKEELGVTEESIAEFMAHKDAPAPSEEDNDE